MRKALEFTRIGLIVVLALAAAALGWLHAQDRLFQMEILRRVAHGELAELLAQRALVLRDGIVHNEWLLS